MSFNTLCNIKYYKEYYAMKYIKTFNQTSEYEIFVNSNDLLLPNVSYVRETEFVGFHPYVVTPVPYVMKAGDIAYWDGGSVKTVALSNWNTSLGTPVGVVVVPTGFAPDGKVRIVSLKPVDKNGKQSDSYVGMAWGPEGTDTSLTTYTMVPTTDNAGSTSTGSYDNGYLPSDMFTGTQSYVDPEAKYFGYTPYIPSPYLGDEPNPEYYKTLDGGNVLSDFNGLSNTQTLVGLGSNYQAANACWNYSDGASNLQWYLPAAGELGYIMPRFNLINASLTAVGSVDMYEYDSLWSSTECNKNYIMYLHPFTAELYYDFKWDLYRFNRPFAII